MRGTTVEQRARWLRVALPVTGAALAVSAVLWVRRLVLLADLRTEEQDAVRAGQDWLAPAWTVASLLFLLTAVLWLHWFAAVHGAAEDAGATRHRGDWSKWGWVLPVLNLFRPKQMVDDAWRAGGPEPVPRQVRAWWAVWFVATLLLFRPRADVRLDGRIDTGFELLATWCELVWTVAVVLATPFAMATVRHLTERLRSVDEVPEPAARSLEELTPGAHQV